jgi:hydroxymethylbilane synthase
VNKAIRIGTRDSKLARWQATCVFDGLTLAGHASIIEEIKSEGDLDLATPLYATGVQGFFTRALDAALLDGRIDIAVHSYKDVPVQLAKGLSIAAVLKRGNPLDVLVIKDEQSAQHINNNTKCLAIATSSVRRKAQWRYHYPGSVINDIRGNVQTRLQKLRSSQWHGAIFAAAGLERLGLSEKETGPQLLLDWMIPAPAQGAIVVVCREEDKHFIDACRIVHDEDTARCTYAERKFLQLLDGGCATPISAFAVIDNNELQFTGNITDPDGSGSKTIILKDHIENTDALVRQVADKMRTVSFFKSIPA